MNMIKIFSAIEFLRNNLRRSEIEASMVVLAQTDIINGDVNEQNVNGNYFVQFLVRMPSLINSVPLCEGKITRIKKTTRGVVQSILDFFWTENTQSGKSDRI